LKKYSIDTSAILDAWVRYYPRDVFPYVWTKLEELIDQGVLFATEEVLFEFEKKDDDVYKWAQQHGNLFVPIDREIQVVVSDILNDHKELTKEGRGRADPFVIALAELREACVLTGEKPTNSLNRPKIPDVCEARGVRWSNILGLFREQKWTF
jgi:hypothetical protein